MEFSTDDPMDLLERGLGLKFVPGGTLSGWGTADGWQTLTSGARIALEVEDQQDHPSTNVLKYWPWLEERPRERLLLFQFVLGVIATRHGSSSLWDRATARGLRMLITSELEDRFTAARSVPGRIRVAV